MQRRRFKHEKSFNERLAEEAQRFRAAAEDRDVGPIAGRAAAVAPNTEKNKDDASPGAAADEQAASRDL